MLSESLMSTDVFYLSSLVVVVFVFPAGDVDVTELLAVHLLESQKLEVYKMRLMKVMLCSSLFFDVILQADHSM